ncbi:MAG: 4-alpha-glucanotransferase [Lachnospiraceae bacterium]|jgi:4-alpha-glucanotransferase|nr:4-alpha-glucanotransferase [Lachnospiraceae bacterium]
MRRSGILLPVTSLPSPGGIGCFSKEAYDFVDFLALAGQSYWQILPMGATGYGDSPYQSFSTFAGNPYFIDLQELMEKGWLSKEEYEQFDFGSDTGFVDYEKIYNSRSKALYLAFEKCKPKRIKRYRDFVSANSYWLSDYSLYMAIKDARGGIPWNDWELPLKRREPSHLDKCRRQYQREIDFYFFQQYLFHDQWLRLKKYANDKGVRIIGDIPIYVALDSADAWANPELFQFDNDLQPTAVAGCPPDYFSADGQLWGNPLYRWEYHRETGYEWWTKRIASSFQLHDVVRIDHFRGFDAYYSIPYGAKNARKGKWQKGPGYEIFKCIKDTLGEKDIIAEDLGFLTPSVLRLVKRSGYPGMKIIQFAFDSREDSDYLPHNYTKNCIVYTGTHDNDTIMGWYRSLAKADRKFAETYLDIRKTKRAERNWEFIRAALASVSDTAIIPMQDYLGLDSRARINTPSTVGGNWQWRLAADYAGGDLAVKIRAMTELYRRTGQ